MNYVSRLFFIIITCAVMVMACSGKKNNSDQEHHGKEISKAVWKEMDEFHIVMAAAFHPYKDSANLEPAKVQAVNMAVAAEKWAASQSSTQKSDHVKSKLDQLKTDSEAFVETVKTGNDSAIEESLKKLHDLFHEIQELWYGEKAEHAE